ERFIFLGNAVSLFLTSFLLATAYSGHVEGLMLLFLLLTLRVLPRNLLLSGLFAGLALATKHTTSLLVLIPIGLVLLAGGSVEGRRPELGAAQEPAEGSLTSYRFPPSAFRF